jgi:hypothetical protein
MMNLESGSDQARKVAESGSGCLPGHQVVIYMSDPAMDPDRDDEPRIRIRLGQKGQIPDRVVCLVFTYGR